MAQVSIQADECLAIRFGETANDRRAKTSFAHSSYEPNRIPELVQFSLFDPFHPGYRHPQIIS
jgi:hypothetical protein